MVTRSTLDSHYHGNKLIMLPCVWSTTYFVGSRWCVHLWSRLVGWQDCFRQMTFAASVCVLLELPPCMPPPPQPPTDPFCGDIFVHLPFIHPCISINMSVKADLLTCNVQGHFESTCENVVVPVWVWIIRGWIRFGYWILIIFSLQWPHFSLQNSIHQFSHLIHGLQIRSWQ